MILINLTPHPIVLRNESGDTTIEPSGTVARVTTRPGQLQYLSGVPVPVAAPDTIDEVVGLPEPKEGHLFIVSGFVGAAIKARWDVVVPGTAPADQPVRDDNGRIVAVTRLKNCF